MKVRFDGVTKEFGTKKGTVRAVDSLSLTIKSGTLFGFLGPSGCGKSTSLFLLSGIYPATDGKIVFDDRDVTLLPPERREVGMVFQNYALYPHLTVRQNVEFPIVNSKIQKRKVQTEAKKKGMKFSELLNEKVEYAARVVEITDYMDRFPSELSGGQQQRVAIARAIVKEPSLLLLDEPLSNLDARLRIQTREEIRKIQRRTKITTVFVTHDQEEALNICDEVAIMKNGVLQQTGEPQYIYDNPANLFVATFLGSFPINILDGRVAGGELFIGEMSLGKVPLPDGLYKVGIRPENLLEKKDGRITSSLDSRIRRGGLSTAEGTLPDGQKIRFVLDFSSSSGEGDRVTLEPRANAVFVFDGEGRKVWQG